MKKLIVLAGLLFALFCFPALAHASTPSGIPFSELEQVVDDIAAEYVGTSTAGAQIAIVQNGEVLLSKSYGYADIERQILVDNDTVFEWGSASKTFVWVSVMQLVEQGKLDLNADIRGYLPDDFFRRLQFDAPITMYNLMNHNAGWEDYPFDLMVSSPGDVLSLEASLRRAEPLQIYEPGWVVAYSNFGAALAGYIVERVTGQPFYAYVNEHILRCWE